MLWITSVYWLCRKNNLCILKISETKRKNFLKIPKCKLNIFFTSSHLSISWVHFLIKYPSTVKKKLITLYIKEFSINALREYETNYIEKPRKWDTLYSHATVLSHSNRRNPQLSRVFLLSCYDIFSNITHSADYN